MSIPFTKEEFLGVFAAYDSAIWPAIPVFTVAGILCALSAFRKKGSVGAVSTLFLAAAWLWIGIVYHIGYFSAINRAAYLFGALFALQGILFLVQAIRGRRLRLEFSNTFRGKLAVAFILYALVAYPLIGMLSGHRYPALPLFGVAPCPTTIFTFAMFLLSSQRLPRYLLVIPALWALIGISAALSLGMVEDIALPIAGLSGTLLLTIRGAERRESGSSVGATRVSELY